ncbi:uncharacterized protein LOC118511931 [Anopheles stephensi]|uniref:uncharacterized protein LOC118511931 n=1 Tax=Anopheles stephensi TaxID=30069 RepID=UPI0007D0F6CE|nr:uncharacterized protein LOC118511931 [Anopheles stephensi]
MAQKRPRISVGVMAVCCGVLSLSVVARESASHNEPGASSRKYVAVHHHPVHPGTFASPVDAPDRLGMAAVTTPLTPDPKATIESERHRKTRETNKFPRPASTSDESLGASPTANQIRRRRMEPNIRGLPSPLVFMPARGRRFGGFEIPAEKRQLTIEQMLEKGDYFVPNRGKKSPTTGELIKKGKFDVLLGGSPDEYFFPNRGKKQYWLTYDSGGNVRPMVARGAGTVPSSAAQQPIASRLRRNLLENLANEHKDTFFSSRGKRLLPLGEELMLVPTSALDDELAGESAQDAGGMSDDRTQQFSGQPNDLDALLWNEDMLLALDQPIS